MRKIYIAALIWLSTGQVQAQTCLLVMSYHQGYAWNDGVEEGVRNILDGRCRLQVRYMDTKRNKTEEHAVAVALDIKRDIDKIKPDIVIAADDNVSRYIVQPFLKDGDIPVVFCAVNWSADKYGYPYKNATGMIEVAPLLPLLRVIRQVDNKARRGIYLGANTFTEEQNYQRVRETYAKEGMVLDVIYADNMKNWIKGFREAQAADFLVLGSSAGVKDWNDEKALETARHDSKVFSVTNHQWMEAFAMYAMNKVPQEQGEWAAEAALRILSGVSPAQIPISVNRKWTSNVNRELIGKAGLNMAIFKSGGQE